MQRHVDQSTASAPDDDWHAISTAPFDRDIELAVIDAQGTHALVFPCRRIAGGWVNAQNNQKLPGLEPSHWREWQP